MAASSSKMQKSNKQIAEMILRVQNLSYDEWLDEQHVALITKNSDVIGKITQLALSKSLPDHPKETDLKETDLKGGD